MNSLLKKLKTYSITDCYALEEDSKEFAILWTIFENINNKEFFLPLVVSNAIISYNVFKWWDEYWEKVASEVIDFEFNKIWDVYLFFIDFLPKLWINEKSMNKKIIKLKKIRDFLDDLYFKQTYYHKNMLFLSQKIAEYSWTFFDDLIVVYTVKMYAYWSRIRFKKHVVFPQEFLFVLDQKFNTLYERYDWEFKWTWEEFYIELCEKLDIPPMHLRTLLLEHYEKLMKIDITVH